MSRRTAPTAGRQQSQQRTLPQPSIKSSHAFAQQNLNQYQQMNAKKQLQQQQLQQQQLQQQMKNYQPEYQEEYGEKEQVGNITKMTVAQAITLITLRLGSIETKLMNNDVTFSGGSVDNESLAIFSNRLDALETKINLSTSTDYKQQIEHLTQSMIQFKNLSASIVKENKELKTQLTVLKKELFDSKQLIEMVKNISLKNETNILQILNMNIPNDDFGIKLDGELELNLSDSEHENDNDIVETDIKEQFDCKDENENDELQMTQIEQA